ncbi:MAG: DinB family protein [Betaproteobacteria bacterium]
MLDLREEIIKSMRASPIILHQLVIGLDVEASRRRPANGEWAVVEVVAHMVDVDRRAHARLRRMLAEEHPFLPAFDQEALAVERGYIDMVLAEQVAQYRRSRMDHVADLDALDHEQWQRFGCHETQGDITVELYEAHVASEDVDHLAQIASILARSGSE